MTCHCGNCEDHRSDSFNDDLDKDGCVKEYGPVDGRQPSLADFKEGTIFRCSQLNFETDDINEVLDKVASTGFADWTITRKSIIYPEASLHVDRNMNLEVKKTEKAPASLEELAWATVNENTEKALALNTQEGRDRYDEQYYTNIEAPDPYKQWLENTDYMSKEEIADRYARFGMALQEIHTMALDSFSGKPLPEAKYMLGLCLGLAGGALNYERPNFEK